MDPASIPKEIKKLMAEIAAMEGKVNCLVEPLEKVGCREQTFSLGMIKTLRFPSLSLSLKTPPGSTLMLDGTVCRVRAKKRVAR